MAAVFSGSWYFHFRARAGSWLAGSLLIVRRRQRGRPGFNRPSARRPKLALTISSDPPQPRAALAGVEAVVQLNRIFGEANLRDPIIKTRAPAAIEAKSQATEVAP